MAKIQLLAVIEIDYLGLTQKEFAAKIGIKREL